MLTLVYRAFEVASKPNQAAQQYAQPGISYLPGEQEFIGDITISDGNPKGLGPLDDYVDEPAQDIAGTFVADGWIIGFARVDGRQVGGLVEIRGWTGGELERPDFAEYLFVDGKYGFTRESTPWQTRVSPIHGRGFKSMYRSIKESRDQPPELPDNLADAIRKEEVLDGLFEEIL